MGCLVEFLFGLFIEIIGPIFVDIFSVFVPEKYHNKTVVKVIAAITTILLWFAFLFGVGFLSDNVKNFWGWLLILSVVIYFAAAALVGYIRNKKTGGENDER